MSLGNLRLWFKDGYFSGSISDFTNINICSAMANACSACRVEGSKGRRVEGSKGRRVENVSGITKFRGQGRKLFCVTSILFKLRVRFQS